MEKREINYIGTFGLETSPEEIKELYDYGLTSLRINMSYRLDYYDELISYLRSINKKYDIKIKLICDLAGTEMRTIVKKDLKVKKGERVIIGKDIILDQGNLSLLNKGDEILISDGEIVLVVDKFENDLLYCHSLSDNVIKNNASVFHPKIYQELPFLSSKDKLNLDDAIKYNADFIAISHVKNKKNIEEIRDYLKGKGAKIKLISKIENLDAIINLEEIIENSDGIMIARGDLGKILPIYELALHQKIITEKTIKAGKYLISATDYLASMIDNDNPRRSEVVDLFMAYDDGIKNIMFSRELSLSTNKANVLTTANKIYESYLKYKREKNL